VISNVQNTVCNEKNWSGSDCSDAAYCCRDRRRATANENPPDRIPNCWLPFCSVGPRRGIPAGSARAWVLEGKNIVIELRFAEDKLDRQRELAAELVRLKVDVIISAGPTVTHAAEEL
jgi:hypothetical protein